jgi:hypothetical protein
MTPVIACNADKDHRPLKPVLTPKGTVLQARRALDFRGFCFSGTGGMLGKCKTTAAPVRSGTVASVGAIPRKRVAKLAPSPRTAGGSILVRNGM